MSNEFAVVNDSDAEETSTPDVYTLDDDGVDTEHLARTMVETAWDLKALNAVVVDLRGLVSYTDFVVICTATSERHVGAIARRVEDKLTGEGWEPIGVEGVETGRWGLLDYGDAILHIFNGSVREDYDLERMWVDAPRLEFEERPDDLYGHFAVEKLG